MSRRIRLGRARLLLVATLVLAAAVVIVPGVSAATDPSLATCSADGAALATQSVDGASDAGVAGPTGPVDDACAAADTAADPPAAADPAPVVDPGPQAPVTSDDTSPSSGTPAERPRTESSHSDDAPAKPAADSAPRSADAAAPAPQAGQQDAIDVRSPAVRAHTRARRAAGHRRASRTIASRTHTRQRLHITEADVYFPPVSVDWASLTPLAPPEFGASEATRFPGPLFLLPIYQAAAAQYDVPWQILASINEVETNFGANTQHSSAGAVGWMQFLPSTWRLYGVDANGDGIANPEDPVDAIFGAARYLHASGSVQDLGRALFSYNHANWYVARVLDRAVAIGSISQDLLASLTAAGRSDADALHRATGSTGYLDGHAKPDTIGRVMLLSDDALAQATLADDRTQIYECGREDIRAGVVDRRILETVEYLAFRGFAPSVSSLRCGHSFHTTSGSVSEHSYGAAVDISRVNGIPILGHQGAGSITDQTIQELLKLAGALRPHQIISLMTFTGASNTLALGDHDDHIHIGFAPVRPLAGS